MYFRNKKKYTLKFKYPYANTLRVNEDSEKFILNPTAYPTLPPCVRP